ncbi:MAG: hypothetical protein HYR85_11830 [Planctomycetes bacterium]|nr:hypothetical protein [Planctomycetota bacterium]
MVSTFDRVVTKTLSFVGHALQDAVVNPDGSYVYVANMERNQIEVIRTLDDVALTPIPTDLRPRGIGISPDWAYLFVGHYLAADSVVNMMRLSDTTVVSSLPGFDNPRRIAVRGSGARFFVTDHNADKIVAVDVRVETLIRA